MTRRRWIADEVSEDTAALNGDNARHLAQVLRARAGQQFDIAANGRVRLGTVTQVSDDRVEFALTDEISASAGALQITLLMAVFKFDRMEWAIEKATELGVGEIIPVIARRTDAHLATAAAKRADRWRKIAKEAAQQSRRVDEPEVPDPVKLRVALGQREASTNKIVLSESEKSVSLGDAMREFHSAASITLAIGPEGGWTPDELKLFAEHGWKAASLGQTILRAETAAIAAVALAAARSLDSQ